MTIKELKEILAHCDDDAMLLAEDKISGRTFSFDNLMGLCPMSDNKNKKSIIVFML